MRISEEGRNQSCWVPGDAGDQRQGWLLLRLLPCPHSSHFRISIWDQAFALSSPQSPLSSFLWCSFPLGHVHNSQLLPFPFQALLREEFTFEAPFWRGALSFSLSLVYWLGLNSSDLPVKQVLGALGQIHASPSLPWRHSSEHDSQGMPVLTKAHTFICFSTINSLGWLHCFVAMDLIWAAVLIWLHISIN